MIMEKIDYVKLFVIVFVLGVNYSDTLEWEKTQMEAKTKCQEQSDTLLNHYRDLENQTVRNALLNRLRDGETAWIQGYANYSSFIAYVGCFSQNISKATASLTDKNWLNSCVVECSNKQEYSHIGVKTTQCYCMSQSDLHNREKEYVEDKNCDVSRKNLFLGQYDAGKARYMVVYEITRQLHQTLATGSESKGQCVYVKDRIDGGREYLTGTCSVNDTLNGSICEKSVYCKQNSTCTDETLERFQMETGLLQAQDQCQNKGGVLQRVPVGDLEDLGKHVYLTGAFRTFKTATTSQVCLSVRKLLSGDLFLEPDDCAVLKSVICSQDLWRGTTDVPLLTTTSMASETVTVDGNKPVDKMGDNNRDNTAIYVGITVPILLVILLATLFLFYRRNKRKAKGPYHRNASSNPEYSDENLLPPNQSNVDNEDNYDSITNGDQRCSENSTTPRKPMRKNKITHEVSYENVSMGTTSNQDDGENEYDRINSRANRANDANNSGDNERNLYAHTLDNSGDNYDTLNNSSKPQSHPFTNYGVLTEVLEKKSDA